MRQAPPSGIVTLLFSDIEGSTRLLHELGEGRFNDALGEHRQVLREAFAAHNGIELRTEGDSFFAAFASAREAVAAAAQAQHALAAGQLQVRIGLHTGEPLPVEHEDGYVGVDVHRAARICAAGHGGQVLFSQATRDLLDVDLELLELGQHRLKDLAEPVSLYQLGRKRFPPLRTLSKKVRLPAPATPLTGRTHELAELQALLDHRDVRLLTLIGPGGTGKTRLALALAEGAAVAFPDGVYWVGLATLRDPSLVSATIAQALDAKRELAAAIGEKRLLLLLDNFEHVIHAAGEVAVLLSACPNLTILVTSREPLHLSAERTYVVSPLREGDAVTLFIERVRAAGVELASDGDVAEICHRVDYLPLAIELAAARVRVMSPRTLLERFEQRLPLLTGGARDLPERQRTLRSTISWSYDMLTPEEQRLFARLAVFSGGCTFEAAEEVCEATVDTLQSLAEKSLLRHTNGRFWMLETIREFAGDRFEESSEADVVRGLHAEFFVELADRRHVDLRGREAALWLKRFEDEHDNFRSVLAYLLREYDSARALHLAGTLSRFWMTRGHLGEGRRWLETTLRACGPEEGRTQALRGLALIEMEQGDLGRAEDVAEEALHLDRESGDEEGIALAMGFLADISAHRGDLDRAASLWQECIVLWRRLGRRLELAIDLYSLAWIARLRREWSTSETYLEESHSLFREVEDVRGEAGTLAALVQIAVIGGDFERARSLLVTATQLYQSIRFVSGMLDLLELSALVLEGQGELEATARLWGARRKLAEEVGRDADHPIDLADHDEAVARVRAALGGETFERAWKLGTVMTLDDAVAFALEKHAPISPTYAVDSALSNTKRDAEDSLGDP